MKLKNGVSIIVLVVTIIIMIILTTSVITMVMGENGIINQAKLARELSDQSMKNEELNLSLMQLELENIKTNTPAVANTDFVQPWLYNDMTASEVSYSLKKLKCAGINDLVVQYVGEVEGGQGSEVKFKNLWYDSSLVANTNDLNLYRPNVLNNIMNAAKDNDMNIYIGMVQSSEWWQEKFKDNTWANNNATFTNQVIDELYNKYNSNTSFKGWYWSNEMYTNDKGYETYWTDMLNTNISYLNTLEISTTKKPLMCSPFISKIYKSVTPLQVENEFGNLARDVNFRDNDIIAVQDSLVISGFSVDEVIKFLTSIKKGIKAEKSNLNFWINVESFDENQSNEFKASSLDRYKAKLQISAKLAEKLVTFSYSHYYLNNVELDRQYRAYLKAITGNEYFPIGIPTLGSVFEDLDGKYVPLPKDFTVDQVNNVVKDGLVIKDKANNEFVWVPVNSGIKPKGTGYTAEEYKNISYMRYLENGLSITSVIEDTIPSSLNDEDQILKYGGFYVARYESSLDYNNGNKRVMVKPSTDAKAVTTFAWQYADSDIYSGYMWNNINYADAKTYSENMSNSYSYDSNVKTGLINGTEWDTVAKWIHSNDTTFNKINDSRSWGNYTDALAPANEGNYQSGVLKATGSNESWKYNNIYDFAGNLAEWTSEKNLGGQYIMRTNGFNANGQYGSASYAFGSDSYQFSNVGFRVVLYIK